MQYDEDDLAESTQSWEGRLAGDDAEAAARALAALRAEAAAEEPADGAASQDSADDVGRCLVIATPREIMALRAAAGAAGTIDEGEPLFGVCAIGLDPDGQAAVESAEITGATVTLRKNNRIPRRIDGRRANLLDRAHAPRAAAPRRARSAR
jgi:hypothetical protein